MTSLNRLRALQRRKGARLASTLATACLLAGTWAPLARADDGAGAAAASAALFMGMTARDLPDILRFIPTDGFTEISANSAEVHRLDAKAFEELFKSGMAINLRLTGMQEQVFGDMAVVTGTRVGGVAPGGAVPAEDQQLATLVWSRVGNGWQLRHIHLSAPSPRR